MARGVKKAKAATLTPEEKLVQVLVPVEEQPYPVPGNWCWIKHNSILDVSGGSQPAKSVFVTEPREGYTQLYQTRDYGEHPVPVYIPDQFATKTSIEGEILLARYGGSLGKVFRAHNGAYNVALAKVLKLFPSLIDDEFLFRYYLSSFYQDFCVKAASGRSAQAGFNRNDMEELVFPLPPFAEQQRIVDRIESLFAKLDEAKEKAQAVVDGFEGRKAAILYKAFRGILTEEWRKVKGKRIDEWKTEPLENRFDVTGGIQKTPSRMPDKNPIPYITVANVYRNRIELSDIRYFEVLDGELDRLKLQYGDILVVEGNGSGNEVGRCAIWRNELPVCIHQNHIIRVRVRDSSACSEYVLHYLNSPVGNQTVKEMAKTTAGLYNLSTGKIKSISVPFASLEEQKEIVRLIDFFVEREQQAREAAEQTLAQIDTMKKAILARAFRGELGTNDPTDESAAELLKRIL